MKVVRFSSADKFRTWLKRNHDKRTEPQVGFCNKKDSGRPGMTYKEALDEVLCALPAALLKKFKPNKTAWTFLNAQAPWYRRKIIHEISSGKKAATRLSWLDRAITAAAQQTRL